MNPATTLFSIYQNCQNVYINVFIQLNMTTEYSQNEIPGRILMSTILAAILYLGTNAVLFADTTGLLGRILKQEGLLKTREVAVEKRNQYDQNYNTLKKGFLWGSKVAAEVYLYYH